MPIRITMDDAASYAASYMLNQQQISDERKAQIMPATKYNLLVKAFNGSSVVLTAAAVSALFLAFSSSFVLFVIGLFVRYTTEQELDLYALPSTHAPAEETHANILRHALRQTTEAEQGRNICERLGCQLSSGWTANEIYIFGFSFWMNAVNIPSVLEGPHVQVVEQSPFYASLVSRILQ